MHQLCTYMHMAASINFPILKYTHSTIIAAIKIKITKNEDIFN